MQEKLPQLPELFRLADPATLHPAQLLAVALPSLLSPSDSDLPSSSDLLEACRQRVRAVAEVECPHQSAELRQALESAWQQDGPGPRMKQLAAHAQGSTWRKHRSKVRLCACCKCSRHLLNMLYHECGSLVLHCTSVFV
jgi:hypothetical protein